VGYGPSYFYGALLLGRLAALLALREISDIRLARIGAPLACMGGAAVILVRSPLGIAFCAAIGFFSASFGAVASRRLEHYSRLQPSTEQSFRGSSDSFPLTAGACETPCSCPFSAAGDCLVLLDS